MFTVIENLEDIPAEFHELLTPEHKTAFLSFFELLYPLVPYDYEDEDRFSFFYQPPTLIKKWEKLDSEEKKEIIKLVKLFLKDISLEDLQEKSSSFIRLLKEATEKNSNFKLKEIMNNLTHDSLIMLIDDVNKFAKTEYPEVEDFIPSVSNIATVIEAIYFLSINKYLDGIRYIYNDDQFVSFETEERCQTSKKSNEVKMHICLSANDFLTHIDGLSIILAKYLENNVIAGFKYYSSEMIEMIKLKPELLKNGGSLKRFFNGDQFTVYFPLENSKFYSEEKIISLCKEIESYCLESALEPGKSTQVEIPITDYLILRKDFYKGEYVSALVEDPQIIDVLKQELENSTLFKSLQDSNIKGENKGLSI